MMREKGKRAGIRKYRPRAFSISLENLERMDKYPRIGFSGIVDKFLSAFLNKLDQMEPTDPGEIVDHLMGDKEEKT